MAAFGDHHLSSVTFGILGNIMSILVYFAPVSTFVKIYKEKSTLGFQSLPYNVAFFSAELWLYYALLKENAPLLISINSFGCVIEICYIVTYLYYAYSKTETARLFCLLNFVMFPLMVALTFFLFKEQERVEVVGWICAFVSVSVFAAPLSIALEVVQTRSVEFMPLPLSFFLTVSAIMWFAYGLLNTDLFIALPNVIGFFLGMLQMVLYVLFSIPDPLTIDEGYDDDDNDNNTDIGVVIHNDNHENKLPEHVLTIIILGTPEAHPINSENRGDGMVHVANTKDEEAADPQDDSVAPAISEASPVNRQKDSAAFEISAA